MINSLFMVFSQHSAFWRGRKFLFGALFRIKNYIFRCKQIKRNTRDNCRHGWVIFSLARNHIIFSLISALVLWGIDLFLKKYSFFLYIPKLNEESYVTFLATISGIGGVFIGLYYAGISTVVSVSYADAPNNIRDLLSKERTSRAYMHWLAFTTFLGVMLIGFYLLGFGKINSAVIVMTLLSGVGIISFVKLGQGMFNLFDPTILGQTIFYQLHENVNSVTAKNYRWNEPSFQSYICKLAAADLNTLASLSDMTKKSKNLNGVPYVRFAIQIIKFLCVYEHEKKKIPSESHWYQEKYEHQNWYHSNKSLVTIALQTGTSLQPTIAKDKEWIERRVLPIVVDCMKINMQNKRYVEVISLIQNLHGYFSYLASVGQLDRAFDFLEKISESMMEEIFSVPENSSSQEILTNLSVIGELATLPICIGLGYRKYIENLDCDQIEHTLSTIKWGANTSLYNANFPLHLLPRLEWLNSNLSFEISAEKQTISPLWYQKTLVLQAEMTTTKKNIENLISRSIELYSSWINRSAQNKLNLVTSMVISVEWEFWHKIDGQIDMWKKKCDELTENRKVKDLPWATLKFDEVEKKMKNRKTDILKIMAQQITEISPQENGGAYPDFIGQFSHVLGGAALEAILKNDKNKLLNIFAPYFSSCVYKFHELRQPLGNLTDWHIRNNFKISVVPLLDVMDISGYAYLMSKYYNNADLWKVVKHVWDNINEKFSDILPLCALAVSETEIDFGISDRASLRMHWKRKIGKKLSEIPSDKISARGSQEILIQHNDPLIRVLSRGAHGDRFPTYYDGIDMFIEFYFYTKSQNVSDGSHFGNNRKFKNEQLRKYLNAENRNDSSGVSE